MQENNYGYTVFKPAEAPHGYEAYVFDDEPETYYLNAKYSFYDYFIFEAMYFATPFRMLENSEEFLYSRESISFVVSRSNDPDYIEEVYRVLEKIDERIKISKETYSA